MPRRVFKQVFFTMYKGKHYKYKGVGPDGDVKSIVDNINKPESVCAMCPDNKDHSIDHFDKENVHVKDID